MSREPFTPARMTRAVKPLLAGKKEFLLFPAETFWKRFGIADDMHELQAQAIQELASVGVHASFEVSLSLLPEEHSSKAEVTDASKDEASSGQSFTADQFEGVFNAIAEAEDGMVIPTTDVFWDHFELTNSMHDLEVQATEKFSAVGVDISFEVVLTLIPAKLPLTMEFEAPAEPEPLDLDSGTLRALSIRQPWAELILRGEKTLEYRSRRMRDMGPLLVHASRALDAEKIAAYGLNAGELTFGAVVGMVDVVGCIEVEGQDGLFAYQLAHPRRFTVPFLYKGAAGIFHVPVAEVRAALESGVDLPPESGS